MYIVWSIALGYFIYATVGGYTFGGYTFDGGYGIDRDYNFKYKNKNIFEFKIY
jgi:hypothetical protein